MAEILIDEQEYNAMVKALSQAKADLAKEKENHKETSECFGIERRRANTAEARAERAEAEVVRLKEGWRQAHHDGQSFFAQSCKNLERAEKSEALAEERGREATRLLAALKEEMDRIDAVAVSVCHSEPSYPECCSEGCACQPFAREWNRMNRALTPEPAKEDGNNG